MEWLVTGEGEKYGPPIDNPMDDLLPEAIDDGDVEDKPGWAFGELPTSAPSSIYIDDGVARRIAAKTTKRITDADRIALIAGLVDEMDLPREQRQALRDLLTLALSDPPSRESLIEFSSWLFFKKNRS